MLVFYLLIIVFWSAHGKCKTSDNVTECNALIHFAQSTKYFNWKNNTHWLNDSVSYCKWFGIHCNTNHNVIAMNLSSNNLNGSIPHSITDLSYLQILDFHSTKNLSQPWLYQDTIFNNTICPSSILNGSLSQLKYIDLGYSYIKGTLPNTINQLSDYMTYLRLDTCRFTGTIPNTIIELTKLNVLKIGRQPLHGTLPFFKYKYPSLTKFAINFAALNGTIPDMFDNFPNIEHLVLDGNGFEGNIPQSIGRLKHLKELGLNMNNLSGVIEYTFCDVWNISDIISDSVHCHIGSDINYSGDPYYANYEWIIPVNGDQYKCPLPWCCVNNSICNASAQSYIKPCYM
eukprot:65716_1